MKKENKALAKWKSLIDQKLKYSNAPFTKSEIIYLRKAIGPSGLKCEYDRLELLNYFNDNKPVEGYNITNDHSDFGAEYLREKSYKKNGNTRKRNKLSDTQLSILDNYFTHKFVGLYDTTNYFGESTGYQLPVYRLIDKDGNWFEYTGNTYDLMLVFKARKTVKLEAVS